MASTLSGQVSTVLKLSTRLLFLFTTCLPTTLGNGHQLFCVPRGSDRICYTLYWDTVLTWTAATDECRRRHTNGRLLTVLDNTTQLMIERSLNGLTVQKPAGGIWLGARLQFLDDWTWVNNDVYKDTEWHQFPDKHNKNKRGYVSARLTNRPNGGQRYFKLEVVPMNDPTRSDMARAVCECQRPDLTECGHTSGKRYAQRAWIKRWHEARNSCTNFTQTDLAVLTGVDIGANETALTGNQPFFIGLRNVRLMWNLSESALEAKYTNWNDDEPAASNTGRDVCAYASNDTWKWHTQKCDQPAAFICENVTSISTTPQSAASASLNTTAQFPDGVASVPSPLSSSTTDRNPAATSISATAASATTASSPHSIAPFSEGVAPMSSPPSSFTTDRSSTSISTTAASAASAPSPHSTAPFSASVTPMQSPPSSFTTDRSYVLLVIAVLAVIVISVIIIVCVVFYFRRRLPQERRRSSIGHTYSSIPGRHVSLTEEESAYSIINDADVTDVSNNTNSAANGNAPNDVHEHASVKKIPRDRLNGRSDGEGLTSNDKTRPAAAVDHPTINVTIADGTAYYSCIPSVSQTHSPTINAQEGQYETPTPVHRGIVFVQPPTAESNQSTESQLPTSCVQESDNETPTAAQSGDVFVQPPASEADTSAECQPQTLGAQESAYETPTPVRKEFMFVQPPAAAADLSTGSQPETSSTQESGYDAPVESAFDSMAYMHSSS